MFEGDGKYSTAASIMQLLAVLQPTSAFGDTYQYSNNMAAAAGFLGGHVVYPKRELGAAYDAAMQQLVYNPLGMKATVPVSLGKLPAGHAAGHGPDIDGKMRVVSQDLNYASISTRPSGNVWSNTHDLLRYVQMELAGGVLPNGRRYIREDVLRARSEPQTTQGLNEYYGMGLKIDRQWGVNVVHHGGTSVGYRSEMIWLPDHNVGAVILINSLTGSTLRSSFRRRLLEILFDGQPIAMEQLKSGAEGARKEIAEQRQKFTIPADAGATGRLATRYRNADLGGLEVRRKGDATWFDFGGWSSEIATQRGEDGAVTFVTVSPEVAGWLEFTLADEGDERRLVTREGEREYVFSEVP